MYFLCCGINMVHSRPYPENLSFSPPSFHVVLGDKWQLLDGKQPQLLETHVIPLTVAVPSWTDQSRASRVTKISRMRYIHRAGAWSCQGLQWPAMFWPKAWKCLAATAS